MPMENLALKQKLDQQQLLLLQGELDKKKRSVGLAYFLLLFLSCFGAHQFYLNNKKRAAVFLSTLGLFALGWFVIFGSVSSGSTSNTGAMVAGTVWFLAGITGITGFVYWFIDLFTLSKQTEEANEKIERELIQGVTETAPR